MGSNWFTSKNEIVKHLLFAFVLISALLFGTTAFGQEPAPKKYLLKEAPLTVASL
jgi:hypothetical protein